MELSQEEQVGLIINDMDARFRSGNSVPVERAHITADNYAVLRAFVVAELQRRNAGVHCGLISNDVSYDTHTITLPST